MTHTPLVGGKTSHIGKHSGGFFLSFLKRFYLFAFREEGREGGIEEEKHRCVRATSILCLSHAPNTPTWVLAHNPGLCPDWESNQRPFGLQGATQPTEPRQPGGQSGSFLEGQTCVPALWPSHPTPREMKTHTPPH